MHQTSKVGNTAFVGDHLPRKCGIATFTSDLLAAVEQPTANRPDNGTKLLFCAVLGFVSFPAFAKARQESSPNKRPLTTKLAAPPLAASAEEKPN